MVFRFGWGAVCDRRQSPLGPTDSGTLAFNLLGRLLRALNENSQPSVRAQAPSL